MTFHGSWDKRYWKNTPGPFYSTTDNLLSLLAFGDSVSHISFDSHCEFIWKQPENNVAFQDCLEAMNCDEMGSYQIDGNQHWTPALVRSWWSRRNELLSWANANLLAGQGDSAGHWKHYPEMTAKRHISDQIHFITNGMEEYLRRYVFLLETGRTPIFSGNLPHL